MNHILTLVLLAAMIWLTWPLGHASTTRRALVIAAVVFLPVVSWVILGIQGARLRSHNSAAARTIAESRSELEAARQRRQRTADVKHWRGVYATTDIQAERDAAEQLLASWDEPTAEPLVVPQPTAATRRNPLPNGWVWREEALYGWTKEDVIRLPDGTIRAAVLPLPSPPKGPGGVDTRWMRPDRRVLDGRECLVMTDPTGGQLSIPLDLLQPGQEKPVIELSSRNVAPR